MSDSKSTLSLGRLMILLLPIIAIALAVNYSVVPGIKESAEQELLKNVEGVFSRMLGGVSAPPTEKVTFVDKDGDLVCDAPADEDCVAPEKLVFSYIPTGEEDENQEVWTDLIAAIADSTGLEVTYQKYDTVDDQLSAMARGELHVTGFNTGAAPMAVEYSGFVPVCTVGRDDGDFGYTMKIITPSGSQAKGPASLSKNTDGSKHRIAFTRPVSNSGFKAAFILLLKEHDMRPERDYDYAFTFDHESSIRDVASGKYDAASVASDILQGMVSDGEIDESSIREVYESERFPPAVIGVAYNLTPELREKITDALLGFEFAGSSVEDRFAGQGVARFVPVSYKDDWANIRRIDEAIRTFDSTN